MEKESVANGDGFSCHIEGSSSSPKCQPSAIHASMEVDVVGTPVLDNQDDPLNWPLASKCLILFVVSLSAFSGTALAVANASGLHAQAAVYHRTPIEISYSLSASTAGIAVGPLLWLPLAYRFGRVAVMFWGTLIAIGCTIWSALMQGKDQFVLFIVSRLLACLFGSVGNAIGSSMILDLFPLHQQGRAFGFYGTLTLAGTTTAPTFSGFLVANSAWPVQLWLYVSILGLVLLMTIFCMKETGYSRLEGPIYPKQPVGFIQNRVATIIGSQQVIPKRNWREAIQYGGTQIQLALLPVTLLVGVFQAVFFGWAVGFQNILAVLLQSPSAEGGYGFSPKQNAYFSFVSWIGVMACFLYGAIAADRIPRVICHRWHRGVWTPELRLYGLCLSLLTTPIGLGIIGVSLQNHLHIVVLGLGTFIFIFGVVGSAPATVNYLSEAYPRFATETTGVLNFYRLIFGLTISFFFDPWLEGVGGPGWTFGMMAFFCLAISPCIGLLLWKGAQIRLIGFTKLIEQSQN